MIDYLLIYLIIRFGVSNSVIFEWWINPIMFGWALPSMGTVGARSVLPRDQLATTRLELSGTFKGLLLIDVVFMRLGYTE